MASISVLRIPGEICQWFGTCSAITIYIGTQVCLWDGRCLSILLCNPLDEEYFAFFVSNGVFLVPLSSSSSKRSVYIPIVDDQVQSSSSVDISTDYSIHKLYETQDMWYALAKRGYEKHLLIISISDNSPIVTNAWPLDVCGLDTDVDVIVCSCGLGRNYIGLSHDMSNLWEIKYDDMNRSPANRKPYLYGDSVVICFDQDIMSVDKRTGKEIWKYSFDVLPTSIQMVEDKVYVVADDLFILDAATGKELIRKNPGLKLHTTEEEKRDERNRIWMHPAEDYIVVCSPLDNFIQLLSPDNLSCMHTIRIPEGYLIQNEYYAFPIIANGKLVVSLYKLNIYDIRALMMIDLFQYQPQDLSVFMPMPEIQHRIVPNLEDEHAYSICIDTDQVFEATGYAEVMVKELATELRQTTQDDYSVKTDWVDKKHNGAINIVLDPSGFDEHEIKTIELEIAELSESMDSNESTFKSLKLFPTDVPPLKIQPKFLPKSEWDKEGEQIDIDEFLADREAH